MKQKILAIMVSSVEKIWPIGLGRFNPNEEGYWDLDFTRPEIPPSLNLILDGEDAVRKIGVTGFSVLLVQDETLLDLLRRACADAQIELETCDLRNAS